MWYDSAASSRCELAQRFLNTAEAIFTRLDRHTTPKQFGQCQETLDWVKQTLEAELAELRWLHFASSSGRLHYCLQQAYQDETAALRARAVLTPPVPPPKPPAPPRPPRHPLADVARQLEDSSQTFLGDAREEREA